MPSHYKRLDKLINDSVEQARLATTKGDVDRITQRLSLIISGDPGKEADEKTDPPTPAVPKKEPWKLIKPAQAARIKEVVEKEMPTFRNAAADDPVEATA